MEKGKLKNDKKCCLKIHLSFILSLLCISCISYSCYSIWGFSKLGNNIYLFEGDHLRDRIIIYNTENGIFPPKGGTPIIPPNETWINPPEGYKREYVEDVNNDKKWIIVKSCLISYSNMNNKINYWIIDKRFISTFTSLDEIKINYIIGPMDSLTFNKILDAKKIKLKFIQKY